MEKQLGTIESGKAQISSYTTVSCSERKQKSERRGWTETVRSEAPVQSRSEGNMVVLVEHFSGQRDTGSADRQRRAGSSLWNGLTRRVENQMISPALAGKNIALVFLPAIHSAMRSGPPDRRCPGLDDHRSGRNAGWFSITWLARLTQPFVEPPDTTKKSEAVHASFDVVYPDGAFGRKTLPEQPEKHFGKGGICVDKRFHREILRTQNLYTKGKSRKIGKISMQPKGAVVIDATGKHVTAGLIDCHSHTAISDGVNEAGQAISAEVRIGDVVDANDVAIYRELAGGLTGCSPAPWIRKSYGARIRL